jgi:hypothetical protein
MIISIDPSLYRLPLGHSPSPLEALIDFHIGPRWDCVQLAKYWLEGLAQVEDGSMATFHTIRPETNGIGLTLTMKLETKSLSIRGMTRISSISLSYSLQSRLDDQHNEKEHSQSTNVLLGSRFVISPSAASHFSLCGASLQQTGRTAFNQSTSRSAPPGESGPLVRRSQEIRFTTAAEEWHTTSLRLDGVRFGQLDACSLGCTGYAEQTHLDQHNKKPNVNKSPEKRIWASRVPVKKATGTPLSRMST